MRPEVLMVAAKPFGLGNGKPLGIWRSRENSVSPDE
jgi:hypothetical protein